MSQLHSFKYSVAFVLFGLLASSAQSVAGFQSEVPESLAAGLAQITEGRVTATISFLASDEMAGRGTPSPEFNIAAAYVAARFRGAGLQGGGKDGSFFQETIMRLGQTPTTGLIFETTDIKPIKHFGLLAGGVTDCDFSGKLTLADLSANFSEAKLSGVIAGKFSGNATGGRAVSQLARLANTLKAAGATALVLYVAEDNELIQLAVQSRDKPRMENPRSKISLPILLAAGEPIADQVVKVYLPKQIVTELPMRNVIGVLPGSDPELAKEAVLFTAHLDHLGARPGVGDGVFNGADDNASGVTGVLSLADAFAALPERPKRSVIFMTFWGEESGLLGSRQFAADPTWPLEKITANVNIEMIGRPEAGASGKVWMTGWQESNLGVLMNEASTKFGVDIFDHPKFSAMLYRSSDNWSFVEKGVIAHSFSAGSLHADYHQPDDEWERLEIPHMTRVIQGLFVGAQPLTTGAATPQKKK